MTFAPHDTSRQGADAKPVRTKGVRYGRMALILATVLCCASPVVAQGWWPFGGNDEPRRPPVPSEPVFRPDAIPAPIPPGAPGAAPPPAANWATKNPICLQLEQRLVQESQKGDQWRSQLPKIEADIREYDRTYNVGAQKLERNCYEYFLFTKSFRSTAQCRDLAKQVEDAKRRLSELETQRQTLVSSGGRSYQDDIVRELARNNCGQNYVDMARRRSGGGAGGFWSDDDGSGSGAAWTPQGGVGVATYRTLCVRTCDGYYFPVSFSTLPSHFQQDASSCQSRCAAPTELYYYPNPGGTVDQSVALNTQQPYTQQKFAFRYRKEYVQGCSCKEAEYDRPQGVAAKGPAQSSWSADAVATPEGAAPAAPGAIPPTLPAPPPTDIESPGSWEPSVN